MQTITDGMVVEAKYTLKTASGKFVDSSEEAGPILYIHGRESILPGLQKEMAGKSQGDSFSVTILPEDAFGNRNEDLIQSVAISKFGENADQIKVGTQFEAESENGKEMLLTATEVTESEIILDGNHPLAGETLHFDVEITNLREASSEELVSGKIGGSCCDQNESPCCN